MASHDDEFRASRQRAARMRSHVPRAVAASYNPASGLVCIQLSTGIVIGLPAAETEGLAGAGAAGLSDIRISPSGYGIHFPMLDADLYLPAVLEGLLGARAWMQARGRKGGQAASEAKRAAARANGKLGGRPRKDGGKGPKARPKVA